MTVIWDERQPSLAHKVDRLIFGVKKAHMFTETVIAEHIEVNLRSGETLDSVALERLARFYLDVLPTHTRGHLMQLLLVHKDTPMVVLTMACRSDCHWYRESALQNPNCAEEDRVYAWLRENAEATA